MVAKGSEVATISSPTSGEIVGPGEEFDWRSVDFNGAFQVLPAIHSGEDHFGDGFRLLEDKATAVGREFLIIDWKMILDPTTEREYASIRLITSYNDLVRMNDGSTGIYRQLKMLESKGIYGGIHCANGLRVSEYVHEDEKGNKTPAKTYYLA